MIIATYAALQLANALEELESIEQQQHEELPAPLLFKTTEAASMKNICLVRSSLL